MTANPFVYHTPGPRARGDLMVLRMKFADLYALIESMTPQPSRERSLALTKLQEASMWANMATVLADPESKPE